MYWYPRLYVGETVKKKKEDLIQKIESGKTPVNTYLVMLSEGRKNQLEIIAVWNLKHWCKDRTHQKVIGLACGWREAAQLVCRITQDVYEQTGNAEIRAFFEPQFDGRTD
ncbi:MAG TPA: hypothetical protein IAB97_10385 [Candidatus Choladousia intestinipullorum]|nr:hypothetical protein [Candidatus Choladousia intestinipullorum]